jgi:hypothetical protein
VHSRSRNPIQAIRRQPVVATKSPRMGDKVTSLMHEIASTPSCPVEGVDNSERIWYLSYGNKSLLCVL